MSGIAGLIGAGSQAVGTIGSLLGARKDKLNAEQSALKSWQRNYDAQKEFAQNSIQWRVQDAKQAGVNPYAVIGGQTTGYTPQDTSYQTNYQQGISQAMNGLSEAMGQLQMANIQAEVEGKKLDNDKKAIELINKAVEARLGQTSATLKDPLNATHTDVVVGTDGLEHITFPDGSQIGSPKGGAESDNLTKLVQAADVWGSPGYVDSLKTANKGRGKTGFTWHGWTYYPEGVPIHPVAERAGRIARDVGTAAAWFTLPWNWAHYGASRGYDKLKSWWNNR